MQRVVRDNAFAGSIDQHQATLQIIARHFPPAVARLYATPRRAGDNTVEWMSEIEGHPEHYRSLGSKRQQALLERFAARQQSIRHLADELDARSAGVQAQALRGLLAPPDLNHLYAINGEPVLTHWRRSDPPTGAPQAPIATIPEQPPSAAPRPNPLWRWLLPLPILLLLALGLLWWFFLRSAPPAKTSVPAPTPPLACIPRPAQGQAPEFAVIFDTSGSMNLNIDVSPEDEDWAYNLTQAQHILLTKKERDHFNHLFDAPQRGDVAKGALADMIEKIPPEIAIGLVTYAGCESPRNQGKFNGAQRPALIKAIHALEMDGGTPLAASLETAASMVDGRNRDAVVVVFVDGEDGCERDQCTAAAQIAQDKPRLKFNVVDITGRHLSNCIAQHTGGTVFNARDVGNVKSMLEQAAAGANEANYCE